MRPGLGGLDLRLLEAFQASLVLVHLGELAVAAVALDQLLFARDLVGLGRHVLVEAGVALGALAVVGGVVAAEHGQVPVAQLPDPLDRAVQERPVVGRDEERSVAPAEVLLEPLEGAQVEVVGRLVEQHQVRVGDHQPGQGGPGLLAAGQGARRLGPLVAGKAEARQRLVDALVEGVAAEDLEAVLELGVERLLDPVGMLQLAQPAAEIEQLGGRRADGRPQVRARP